MCEQASERRRLDLLVKWLMKGKETVEVLCEQVCVLRIVNTARRAERFGWMKEKVQRD